MIVLYCDVICEELVDQDKQLMDLILFTPLHNKQMIKNEVEM